MIKSILATNYLGESINIELGNPDNTGFLITDIQGLGPTKANINMTEAMMDGSSYNSARTTYRNIVLTIVFTDGADIEQARLKSYKYFPIKKNVTLRFTSTHRTCEILGYVESNEPDIFSKQVSTKISIICPDPYFYSLNSNVTVFANVEPMFEFEFSNESLSTNLLTTGMIVIAQEKTLYYEGDSEVGVRIVIHANGPAKHITIYNTLTRETMKIDTDRIRTMTGSDLILGDDIIINTVSGKKTVQLLRNGDYYNILNCLSRDSDWFRISKGDNIFAYTAESGSTNLEITIYNQILYEGI